MRYLIALLALAGLVISCFALREHFRTEPSPCSINERWDCVRSTTVRSPNSRNTFIESRSLRRSSIAVGEDRRVQVAVFGILAMRPSRASPWRGAGGSYCCSPRSPSASRSC